MVRPNWPITCLPWERGNPRLGGPLRRQCSPTRKSRERRHLDALDQAEKTSFQPATTTPTCILCNVCNRPLPSVVPTNTIYTI